MFFRNTKIHYKQEDRYYYPLTTAKQVILPDGCIVIARFMDKEI